MLARSAGSQQMLLADFFPARRTKGIRGQFMADFDLAVIGGGINGVGIARDAAGRGLKVVLVEQNDLASGTSSASSKLIHGGLRYLEHGALRLVRAALSEREVLLRMAPHLIRPLRFVLPLDAVEAARRPLLRLGLVGLRPDRPTRNPAAHARARSDHRCCRRSRSSAASTTATNIPTAFADDARLVVLNAVDAAERGASIRTRTRCVRAERADVWRFILNARGERDGGDRARADQRRRSLGGDGRRRRCCVSSRCTGFVSTRAATSWCRGSTTTTALIFCRQSTRGWCLRFRSSATSR